MVFADVSCPKCGFKIELQFMDSFLPAKECTCTQDNGTKFPMCFKLPQWEEHIYFYVEIPNESWKGINQ